MIEVFWDVTLLRAYGPNVLQDCGAVIFKGLSSPFPFLVDCSTFKDEGTTRWCPHSQEHIRISGDMKLL